MKKEDEITEFKKTTGELNEGMVSISSILNKHRKGTLYFGVKNDGTPHKFTITDSTLRDVSRKIFEAIKPQIFPTVFVETISGTEVIRVDFEGNDIPYSAFGKYYIRTADEDRELNPSELRKLMIGKEYEENWESKLTDETVSDVDEIVLGKFYDQAVSCNRLPEMPFDTFVLDKSLLDENTPDAQILLEKLGLLRLGKLTNAGRMLFSKNRPLTLKMAVFATSRKDTFLDIVREEGNIFQLIDAAFKFVIKNIRWRVELGEDSIQRNEIPEIPLEALREAIVNCFAHARYDIAVQHEIDIFSNRISITNPGSFANEYRPIDFFERDAHSFLRNETIARILYLCKDVETFGSGLRKIYSLCGKENIEISYINDDSVFTIEFSRSDRNAGESNGTINDTTNGTINSLEENVLSLLMKNPRYTSSDLIEKTNKSLRTINRTLASLKAKRLIKRVGSNKSGHWEIER